MEEMQELFVEHPHFSISGTKAIAATCKRLEMGADLNIEEFLLLKRVIFASRELKNFYDNLENSGGLRVPSRCCAATKLKGSSASDFERLRKSYKRIQTDKL